jgi:hypothetical protein
MPCDIVTHSQAFYSQLRGIVSNLALLTAVQVLVLVCLERSRGVEPRPLAWRANVQAVSLAPLVAGPTGDRTLRLLTCFVRVGNYCLCRVSMCTIG